MQFMNPVWILIKTKHLKKKERKRDKSEHWISANIKKLLKFSHEVCCCEGFQKPLFF